MKRDIPFNDMKFTPLDILLDLWTQWQRKESVSGSGGFARRDSICKQDSGRDSEQLFDDIDKEVAEGVDACISSLKAQHSWAIKKRCDIASVWRFPQIDYFSTLSAAEKDLEGKLRKNVATSNYFN
jgi:hypothetical protein